MDYNRDEPLNARAKQRNAMSEILTQEQVKEEAARIALPDTEKIVGFILVEQHKVGKLYGIEVVLTGIPSYSAAINDVITFLEDERDCKVERSSKSGQVSLIITKKEELAPCDPRDNPMNNPTYPN